MPFSIGYSTKFPMAGCIVVPPSASQAGLRCYLSLSDSSPIVGTGNNKDYSRERRNLVSNPWSIRFGPQQPKVCTMNCPFQPPYFTRALTSTEPYAPFRQRERPINSDRTISHAWLPASSTPIFRFFGRSYVGFGLTVTESTCLLQKRFFTFSRK
jgi:hypothetical protein